MCGKFIGIEVMVKCVLKKREKVCTSKLSQVQDQKERYENKQLSPFKHGLTIPFIKKQNQSSLKLLKAFF